MNHTNNKILIVDDDKQCLVELSNILEPQFYGEVLVCEDNDHSREVICDHLTAVGIKAAIVHNGKEGLDLVLERMNTGEEPFDLILMDIQMPVMDGLEAASKMVLSGVETPIVAFTANIISNDLEIYRTSGFSYIIRKPFVAQDLWQCLYKYLRLVEDG